MGHGLLCLPGRAGEESGSQDARWTRKGPIPQKPVRRRSRRRRLQVEVGEVVAADKNARVKRVDFDGNEEEKMLQAGDKVYVDDRIHVGGGSHMEITLGNNARIKVGPKSALRVLDKSEQPLANQGGVMVRRDLELEEGSARLRVRENTLRPSPIVLVAGDVQVFLQRSDAAFERKSKDAKTVMLLRGLADLKMFPKGARSGQVLSRKVLALGKAQKIEIPSGEVKQMPEPVTMSRDEVSDIQTRLGFTIDQERPVRPAPPRPDVELDGP